MMLVFAEMAFDFIDDDLLVSTATRNRIALHRQV